MATHIQHCSGFPPSPGFLTSASCHAGHVSRVNTRYLVHVTACPRDRCDTAGCYLHVSHFHCAIEERVFEYDIQHVNLLRGTEDTNMNYFSEYTSTKSQIIIANMLLRRCMLVLICSFVQHKITKALSSPVFAKPLRCGQDSAAPRARVSGGGRPDAGRGRQVDSGQSGGARGAGRIQQ